MVKTNVGCMIILPHAIVIKSTHLEEVPIVFHLAVNEQITNKTQNNFYLIFEHSDLIKYSLNTLN